MVVYQARMNSLTPSLILKACMDEKKKLVIEGKMGTIDQYPWISAVNEYVDT